jgi:hypothetical protein
MELVTWVSEVPTALPDVLVSEIDGRDVLPRLLQGIGISLNKTLVVPTVTTLLVNL